MPPVPEAPQMQVPQPLAGGADKVAAPPAERRRLSFGHKVDSGAPWPLGLNARWETWRLERTSA